MIIHLRLQYDSPKLALLIQIEVATKEVEICVQHELV